jgi:hypothetical protein
MMSAQHSDEAGMNGSNGRFGLAMALLALLALAGCKGTTAQPVDESFDHPAQCWPADCRELLPDGP